MADATKKTHWTEFLQHFDRRWIFLAMAAAVVIPQYAPLGLPVNPQPMVTALYRTIESLEPGDTVFISLDMDPASKPELEPFIRGVFLHLKRKQVKAVIGSAWYSAPPLVEQYIRDFLEKSMAEGDPVWERNKDFVWLGFREGKEAVLQSMGRDLRATFDQHAADGTALAEIPMFDGIKALTNFDLLISVSAGSPGAKEYVENVQARYGVRMVAACTAVSTTDLSPYYQSGQLLGLAGGMAGVAEYEALLNIKGNATKGNDALNIGSLLVIAAIVFGNFIYFAGRMARRRGLT